MEKNINFTINEDIYETFCLAVNLTKEDQKRAIENSLKWYIATTFEKIYKEYQPQKKYPKDNNGNKRFFATARKKIPSWAVHPEQYCHKILRGFFLCKKQHGLVLLDMLEEICSKEEIPELYVPTFRNNYYQMKFDGAKTYGKVFEDDGTTVKIWCEIENILEEYKVYFCN